MVEELAKSPQSHNRGHQIGAPLQALHTRYCRRNAGWYVSSYQISRAGACTRMPSGKSSGPTGGVGSSGLRSENDIAHSSSPDWVLGGVGGKDTLDGVSWQMKSRHVLTRIAKATGRQGISGCMPAAVRFMSRLTRAVSPLMQVALGASEITRQSAIFLWHNSC